MATAWVRSLSCKSSAVADDVYRTPLPKKQPPPVFCAPKKLNVTLLPAKERPRSREQDRPARMKQATSKYRKKPKPASPVPAPARPSSAFLTMKELPEGHSSRRVVELILASGWGRADAAEVEALFRVHCTARAVARFEDARAAARARGAADADARCAADGNEMMRFQCRAAEAGGEMICATVATCRSGAAESASAVRTFAGSGAAHDSAGGGAGRRGMLVCRVIAGRVRPANESTRHASEYDSVDTGGGELVVLDSSAVLPCFLVIYKVKALESPASCRSR